MHLIQELGAEYPYFEIKISILYVGQLLFECFSLIWGNEKASSITVEMFSYFLLLDDVVNKRKEILANDFIESINLNYKLDLNKMLSNNNSTYTEALLKLISWAHTFHTDEKDFNDIKNISEQIVLLFLLIKTAFSISSERCCTFLKNIEPIFNH